MIKKLSQILPDTVPFDGKNDFTISSLSFDSRSVQTQSIFFALPGIHVHGNTFVARAIEAGAVAIVYEGELPNEAIDAAVKADVTLIHVEDARFAMSPIAAKFYDNPGTQIGIFGVTGTEGKSTTVFLIWQFLRLLGKKSGFISTVQYSLGGDAIDNSEHQTTPEAPIIQEKLYQMLHNGCEYAVIEASSHGLSPKTNRLGDVTFDGVAMMNVTHEHLEFHGTHEQYKSDKANLFRNLATHNHVKVIGGKERHIPCFGAVNLADPAAQYFAKAALLCSIAGFTSSTILSATETLDDADNSPFAGGIYRIENLVGDEGGANFTLCSDSDTIPVRINLPGTFNADNTVAAMLLVAAITETDIKTLVPLAAKLLPVRGRMTAVNKAQPFEVLVDYAHTPSSFTTIFPPLRQRVGSARIITVFGSGGERDTKKRPVQGKIAAKYSDIVILADEDPRGEDPLQLLEDIAVGCTNLVRNKNLFLIPDRPQAIRKAFSLAQKGDLVLLLGKAHENSIIYKDYAMDYDEITEAEKALMEMGF